MNKKINKKLYAALMDSSVQAIYKWIAENRKIIKFINLFSDSEINEFLECGELKKYSLIKNLSIEDLERLLKNKSTEKNQSLINTQLNQINRVSILYFLVIFKEYPNINDNKSLMDFLTQNQEKSDSFINFLKKTLKNILLTIQGENNISFDFHLQIFNEDRELYLDRDDIDYIFKYKERYTDILTKMARSKLKK